MRSKILCGLAIMALAAGVVMAIPADSQAQLFNTTKKKEQTAPSGTTADKGKPQSGALFNHSNKAAPATRPNYGAPVSRAQPMKSRTVLPATNGGFNRKAGTGSVSEQDKRIREAAMRRVAKANAAQAAVKADIERRRANPEAPKPVASREDRNFGTMVDDGATEDTRSTVYDKYKGARDPDAPVKLFNSSR
jgi:hypothetical protein